MDDKAFQEKLAALVKDINQLPAKEQASAQNLANEAKARQERMKKTIGELTESLDYLRLSVKYLVFDLEATRRENKYLRDIVEKLARGNTDGTAGRAARKADSPSRKRKSRPASEIIHDECADRDDISDSRLDEEDDHDPHRDGAD